MKCSAALALMTLLPMTLPGGALRADPTVESPDASPRRWSGAVAMVAGAKWFGDGVWGPTHQEIGFRADLARQEKPLRLTIGFLVAARTFEPDKPEELDAFLRAPIGGVLGGLTAEIDVGARLAMRRGARVRPWIGAGVSSIFARFDYKGREPALGPAATSLQVDRDSGWGLWAGCGFVHSESPRGWGWGLEARASTAPVELLTQRVNAGGIHLGLVVEHGL